MTKAQREIRDRNPMPYREKLLVKKALRNCELQFLQRRVEHLENALTALTLIVEEMRFKAKAKQERTISHASS